MPPVDRAVDRTESLLSVSNSSRPSGRPAREPLLSGSRPGRPVGSTVKNMTVGDRKAILPFPAANGQIWIGAINTPFLG